MENFLTLKEGVEGTGNVTEKKSRFISFLSFVPSEEAAMLYLERLRKKHRDARHVVFAWRLLDEKGRILERASDDGEPAQTAGAPTLTLLKGKHLVNVCLVTVRYFGGTLLGPGGLKRAYATAAENAYLSAESSDAILTLSLQEVDSLRLDYAEMERFSRLLRMFSGEILEKRYESAVFLRISLPHAKAQDFWAAVVEEFSGRLSPEKTSEAYLPQRVKPCDPKK